MIDIHAHIWGQSIRDGKMAVLSAAEKYGIERVYISGLQSYSSDESEVDFLNEAVYQFMKENPEKIGGSLYVNPLNGNVMDVIKRGTQEQGFEMIKLWCCTLADDPSMDPIMDYAAENGIPVLFHAFKKSNGQVPNESTGIHIANIARRHPDAKIIMAHCGGNFYDGIPCVRGLKNVWCDHSGTPFHRNEVKYAVENMGAERVLFGTDNAFATNIAQVMSADLTDDQKKMIFSGNAKKILDRNYRV